MSNELVAKNAITDLAKSLGTDATELQNVLKKTVFKNCQTNEEFLSAVIAANTYKLNPILKQIYAFPAKGGGVIPVVSIDGWVKIVTQSKGYNGVEFVENKDDKGKIESITCKIYIKDQDKPCIVTEYLSECQDLSKDTWKRWPIRMLRHKAYIQCARMAFGLSGIYDEDEAERIREATDVTPGKPDVDIPQSKKKTVVEVEEDQKEEPASLAEKNETKKQKEDEKPKEEYFSLQDVLNLEEKSEPLPKVKCFIKSISKTQSAKSGKTIAIIQCISSYSSKSPANAEIRMFTDADFVAGVEYIFINVRSAAVVKGKMVYAADTAMEANDDAIEL